MYRLTKLCYCCLTWTDNLVNIDGLSPTDAELVHALTYFGLNVYWPDTTRTISVCEKCSSKVRNIFEFVSGCHKNSGIMQQGHLDLFTDEKEIVGTATQFVFKLEDSAASASFKMKLENRDEDNTEAVTNNSENTTMSAGHSDISITPEENEETVAATTEKQCLIKPEIQVGHEEYLQSSLEEKEIFIELSELDIKEHFMCYMEESEEKHDTSLPADTLASSETPLNEVPTNWVSAKRNTLNQTNGVVSARVEKLLECPHCGKYFICKSYLDRHIRMHTGEWPNSCAICKKSFISKASLKSHMRKHIDGERFPCIICLKTFFYKHQLKQHMYIHVAAKPYKCSTCNKGFRTKSNLHVHGRVHTGEKPFACPLCNKGFKQKSHLNIHYRIHSDEKPFECSVCRKAFKQKTHLNTHMKTHIRK